MRLAIPMLLILTLFHSVNVTAEEPAGLEANDFMRDVKKVDISIKYFMRTCPGKPIMRSATLREEMAQAIVTAANTHGVPPLLLTTIVYNESTFDITAKGKLGEIGLTQVHGLAAKGCELDTAEGQLDCGARWLAHYYPKCETWERSLTAYATKGKCVSESLRTKDKISYRMRQWKRITKETEAILNPSLGG